MPPPPPPLSPPPRTATITALQHLASYETARCDEWRAISQQYSSAYDALRKQCQAGREEQQECLAYLQQRTQADLEYARKLSGQRLTSVVLVLFRFVTPVQPSAH